MPELPEVESLAIFLRERAVGRIIDWAASASFAVLKTYQPDLGVLTGREITGAGRHGKFLDLLVTPADGVPVPSGPAGELHLSLPRTATFLAADLSPADTSAQIKQAEGG